ncbi:hypothetical protein LSAT2_011292 [Lamellibrachia satsuma]|nr:hypothetical protein LSAT2_011292 [Lamellibrachia satsuma]
MGDGDDFPVVVNGGLPPFDCLLRQLCCLQSRSEPSPLAVRSVPTRRAGRPHSPRVTSPLAPRAVSTRRAGRPHSPRAPSPLAPRDVPTRPARRPHSPRVTSPLAPRAVPTRPARRLHSPGGPSPLAPRAVPTRPARRLHSPRAPSPLAPRAVPTRPPSSCASLPHEGPALADSTRPDIPAVVQETSPESAQRAESVVVSYPEEQPAHSEA